MPSELENYIGGLSFSGYHTMCVSPSWVMSALITQSGCCLTSPLYKIFPLQQDAFEDWINRNNLEFRIHSWIDGMDPMQNLVWVLELIMPHTYQEGMNRYITQIKRLFLLSFLPSFPPSFSPPSLLKLAQKWFERERRTEKDQCYIAFSSYILDEFL